LLVLWCALAAAGVCAAVGRVACAATNGLASDVYGANGNTRTNGADTFQYDVEGRLTNAMVSGVSVACTYNADGVRISKTSGGKAPPTGRSG